MSALGAICRKRYPGSLQFSFHIRFPCSSFQTHILCTEWIFCSLPTKISILIDLCNSTSGNLKDRWAPINLSPCLGSSFDIGGPRTEVPQGKLSPFTGCVMTLVWFIYLFEVQFLIRIIISVWPENTGYLSNIFIPSCLVKEHDFFF